MQHFWLVRPGPEGIEVPLLRQEVAEVFKRAGWEVAQLPVVALTQEELRCLRAGVALLSE